MSGISELLARLDKANDDDEAFIIAATLNLHKESMRRLFGRVLYEPADVKNLFSLISTITTPLVESPNLTPARSEAPNAEEEKKIIQPVRRA